MYLALSKEANKAKTMQDAMALAFEEMSKQCAIIDGMIKEKETLLKEVIKKASPYFEHASEWQQEMAKHNISTGEINQPTLQSLHEVMKKGTLAVPELDHACTMGTNILNTIVSHVRPHVPLHTPVGSQLLTPIMPSSSEHRGTTEQVRFLIGLTAIL